ncbi:MAG: 2-succinyl-5-enolpyruvyl-6-hydroxy-3-cyclohexene-1-carboxylic-acid synthase [Chlamydiia bacterium]|nr:2-succinyl-5-enolpyruvyl-6-hydroxy-3-cyclohexene-1-carboxylic-acid synthase [Chlamydiia bacterium]
MAGAAIETERDQIAARSSCENLAREVISSALATGIREFCICTGKRDAPLILLLKKIEGVRCYYWSEERSSAFFALGRIRVTKCPVAVITTSGSAAAELLPAAMEAHYTGLPLLMMTADRPRKMRGTGAPQAVEQVGLFSHYTHFEQDMESGETCALERWGLRGPAHLNVCFEEPKAEVYDGVGLSPAMYKEAAPLTNHSLELSDFLHDKKHPLAIVSTLSVDTRDAVHQFLKRSGMTAYLEAVSGLREKSDLQGQRTFKLTGEYDAILRIGGVPTARIWRDLEEHPMPTFCLSEQPFSGLSWMKTEAADITKTLNECDVCQFSETVVPDLLIEEKIRSLPLAEPSLVRALSEVIPKQSLVYLGNSMPIREWDRYATSEDRGFEVAASRGVNGIDGQLSTFLGFCSPKSENWAIVGDLTALYDLVAPWIFEQMDTCPITIVIINNGGGKIFSHHFPDSEMQCRHSHRFEYWAKMWNFDYLCWHSVPETLPLAKMPRVIELIPDEEQTVSFWKSS